MGLYIYPIPCFASWGEKDTVASPVKFSLNSEQDAGGGTFVRRLRDKRKAATKVIAVKRETSACYTI